ncbi:hypothetical protein R9X47_00750 [Wukongibacter baidiensis]
MSYCDISIEEIHKLQSKLERLDEGTSSFNEILKVSEEIDTMLAK